jgi:hypothetical protein
MKQYAASTTIQQLITDWDSYFNTNWENQLYDVVWNVDTAQGFGLDIWGRIVIVSRNLTIPDEISDNPYFGYTVTSGEQSWYPFNHGTFYSGENQTNTVSLTDQAYRVLILAKALSNISATDSKSINQALKQLFPGRGRTWVNDLGSMAMRFVFEFSLESWEKAVLVAGNVLPRPAGVSAYVFEVPANSFGFAEAAGSQTFNHGTFLSEGAITNVT